MTSLKERIRRSQRNCGFQTPPGGAGEEPRPELFHTSPVRLTSPGGSIQTDINGYEMETPFGPCFYREKWILPEPACPWQDLQRWPARLLSVHLVEVVRGTLAEWLYLDVETTGLGGGVGVIAFMVGIGEWDAGALRVRQYFLRDIDEEPAMLWAIEQHLRQAPGIVTYNGRAYDRHVLWNRMRLHRMDLDVRIWPHIDLYPWIRSLWQGIWPDTRLQTVERQLWGWQRTMDLRGSEIPAAYRLYLTRGWHAALYQVFEHNLQDIRSLVALTLALVRWAHDPMRELDDEHVRFRLIRRLTHQDWRWGLDLWERMLMDPKTSSEVRSLVLMTGLRLIRRHRAWIHLNRWVRAVEGQPLEALTPIAWARAAYYAYRYLRDAERSRRFLRCALHHPNPDPRDRQRWNRRLNWLERKRQPPLSAPPGA